ncbi:MAG: hypothetical protein IT158_31620 [Bryobacterales bacterium]|nr:hypothetical protein [Bryobacterales bacterium]
MNKRDVLCNLFNHTPEAIEDDEEKVQADLTQAAVSQLFRKRVFAQGANEVVSAAVTTVPSNKQLHIEFATAELRVDDASDLVAAYIYSVWPIQHFLTPHKVYNYVSSKPGPASDRWMISQPTGLIAQPGEVVNFVAAKSNVLGNMSATFSFFGHFEDV